MSRQDLTPESALPAPDGGARPDPWQGLRAHTRARIALGRSGASLPTAEVLRLTAAHAQARDAVHQAFDSDDLAHALRGRGLACLGVDSAAPDRSTYLQRPDLGRRLAPASVAALQALPALASAPCDVLVVVGDGLSALAVHRQALQLLDALLPSLASVGLSVGPVVLVRQARVAVGDEIGACLQACLVVMLLGGRPGLSSPDSLGAYLTWAPRVGRSDAERNCVSNIRPEGLAPVEAAHKLTWLCVQALRLGLTGIGLKDDSGAARLAAGAAAAVGWTSGPG